MAITHDQSHGPAPSGPDAPDSGEKDNTLLVQGAILGGIVVLLVILSFFDVI